MAICSPILSSVFLFWAEDCKLQSGFNVSVGAVPLWSICIPCSALIGTFVYFTSKPSVPPAYNFVTAKQVLTIFGFGMAVVWICIICGYLVDSLYLLGIVLDLPNELLGMTLLAWGNSIGDLLANVSIAKMGLSQTALTACYAGPLFNILIGLGVSLCIATIKGPVAFPLLTKPTIVVSLGFLLCSLALSMLYMTLRQGTMTRALGKLQLVLYLAFTVTLVVVLA